MNITRVNVWNKDGRTIVMCLDENNPLGDHLAVKHFPLTEDWQSAVEDTLRSAVADGHTHEPIESLMRSQTCPSTPTSTKTATKSI